MKLLFDENISWRIKKLVDKHFPNSIHVSDIKKSLITDMEIWKYAKQNNFVIVTFDEDFFNIQMIENFPPKIIWLRHGNTATKVLSKKIISLKNTISDFCHNEEQGVLEVY